MSTPLIDMNANPFDLFSRWLKEAETYEPNDPNAMSVATADSRGRPSVRTLLLKGFDQRGFVFYTNTLSRKGQELAENPYAALLFYWKSLHRQIRIEGKVVPVSAEEADAYFATRSRISRIGALASEQSHPLADRAILEQKVQELEKHYPGDIIPRPDNWSGYRVIPNHIEFWQDRPYRLHDRAVWTLSSQGTWSVTRLYP
ncbi:pyridoxamine 5'-phosphate oxidase [Entomobacter blattae]|uniref:Pyridoxine/pyridoxamine 5'-phosphate oxidase n=1 Tax=Entomobacter blattae TaxID=2762277 RepID=A0A7H1NQI6_9PROT|nr:pyridoxamine 5'-phosphate oxidase [Entomobacter blattae]QNT78046.1 Pyridoxine/pyridoxamine 5'-phosphate oxidase [Entomobacter blattae]